MEITSFILGVCAVIILLMVAGTSVNYMSTKQLKEEIKTLKMVQRDQAREIDEQDNTHLVTIEYTRDKVMEYTDQLHSSTQEKIMKLYRHVDSRTDKLDASIQQHLQHLQREIERVEKGYKEKINY
jgi:transcription termination factor NusB